MINKEEIAMLEEILNMLDEDPIEMARKSGLYITKEKTAKIKLSALAAFLVSIGIVMFSTLLCGGLVFLIAK